MMSSSSQTTILGDQMQALGSCLKDAALNTGKVFRFYTDARKERISSRAPYPPPSITKALGRSLERYDRLCDTIETQLQHAIAALQRDLKREQARLRAETAALAAAEAAAAVCVPPAPSPTTMTRPSLTSVSLAMASMASEQIPMTDSPTSIPPPSQFPPPSGASAVSLHPRRTSTILSSLNRPNFPLKLDLSAAALAGGHADRHASPVDASLDLGLATGLPSPVTLAPKTARAMPNDPSIDIFGSSIPPDVTGGVGMKTTQSLVDEVIDLTGPEPSSDVSQLGNSADKPIELDLDAPYENLFGGVHESHPNQTDHNNTAADVGMESLFSPEESESFSTQQNAAGTDSQALLADLSKNNEGGTNDLSSLMPEHETTASDHPASANEAYLGDFSNLDLSSFFDHHMPPGTVHPQQAEGHDDIDIMSQLLSMDGSGQGESKAS